MSEEEEKKTTFSNSLFTMDDFLCHKYEYTDISERISKLLQCVGVAGKKSWFVKFRGEDGIWLVELTDAELKVFIGADLFKAFDGRRAEGKIETPDQDEFEGHVVPIPHPEKPKAKAKAKKEASEASPKKKAKRGAAAEAAPPDEEEEEEVDTQPAEDFINHTIQTVISNPPAFEDFMKAHVAHQRNRTNRIGKFYIFVMDEDTKPVFDDIVSAFMSMYSTEQAARIPLFPPEPKKKNLFDDDKKAKQNEFFVIDDITHQGYETLYSTLEKKDAINNGKTQLPLSIITVGTMNRALFFAPPQKLGSPINPLQTVLIKLQKPEPEEEEEEEIEESNKADLGASLRQYLQKRYPDLQDWNFDEYTNEDDQKELYDYMKKSEGFDEIKEALDTMKPKESGMNAQLENEKIHRYLITKKSESKKSECKIFKRSDKLRAALIHLGFAAKTNTKFDGLEMKQSALTRLLEILEKGPIEVYKEWKKKYDESMPAPRRLPPEEEEKPESKKTAADTKDEESEAEEEEEEEKPEPKKKIPRAVSSAANAKDEESEEVEEKEEGEEDD